MHPRCRQGHAGLRLLGGKQSKDVLDAVASRLREKYEFHLKSNDDVAIMDGKDEGVFAWITANYLLHVISGSCVPRNQRIPEKTTFAVLDLGEHLPRSSLSPCSTRSDRIRYSRMGNTSAILRLVESSASSTSIIISGMG